MADGKMLGDLLHVLGVKEGVVAGFVWRSVKGERRGRHKNRMNRVDRWRGVFVLWVSLPFSRRERTRKKEGSSFFFPPPHLPLVLKARISHGKGRG